MIRLVFFVLSLLLVIYAALVVFGDDGDSIAEPADKPDGSPKLSITSLLPESTPAVQEAAPVAIPVPVPTAEQTPEVVQQFPGPELKPAPEAEVASNVDATDATGPVLYVIGERVNFRAGPSTDFQVVGALTHGSEVVALGPTESGWINIRSTDGTSGYMSGRFLSVRRPSTE